MRSCVPMAEAVGWIAHQLGWQAPASVPWLYPRLFRVQMAGEDHVSY